MQRIWNTTIDEFFRRNGFIRCQSNYNVYVTLVSTANTVFLVLYVDELLIFSKNVKALDIVKKKLFGEFDMKDLEEVSYCFGLQITQNKRRRPSNLVKRGTSSTFLLVLEWRILSL